MAISVVELDEKLVKALKIMNSGNSNATQQLKILLDEAIKEKYGSSCKPISVLSKINSSSSSSKKLSVVAHSDEPMTKKPKSHPDSKISKLISKHSLSPSGSPSPPTLSMSEDNVEMKSEESSQASTDSQGSPGLEIVDDYNKCFVCKNKRVCGSGSSNKLIECAECHSSYHQECHTPPISDSDAADPRLIWYCVQCMRTMNRKTAAPLSSKSNTKSSNSSSKSGSSISYSSSMGSSSKYSSSTSSLKSNSTSSTSTKAGVNVATTSSSLISADKRIQIMKKRAASKKPEPPKKGKK